MLFTKALVPLFLAGSSVIARPLDIRRRMDSSANTQISGLPVPCKDLGGYAGVKDAPDGIVDLKCLSDFGPESAPSENLVFLPVSQASGPVRPADINNQGGSPSTAVDLEVPINGQDGTGRNNRPLLLASGVDGQSQDIVGQNVGNVKNDQASPGQGNGANGQNGSDGGQANGRPSTDEQNKPNDQPSTNDQSKSNDQDRPKDQPSPNDQNKPNSQPSTNDQSKADQPSTSGQNRPSDQSSSNNDSKSNDQPSSNNDSKSNGQPSPNNQNKPNDQAPSNMPNDQPFTVDKPTAQLSANNPNNQSGSRIHIDENGNNPLGNTEPGKNAGPKSVDVGVGREDIAKGATCRA